MSFRSVLTATGLFDMLFRNLMTKDFLPRFSSELGTMIKKSGAGKDDEEETISSNSIEIYFTY